MPAGQQGIERSGTGGTGIAHQGEEKIRQEIIVSRRDMNSCIETLNQRGEFFLSFAWPMLWQSSLLIAILLAVDFSLRRRLRASIRYALWLVVLVKLCLPPTLALPTSPAWWLHQSPPPVAVKTARHYTVTYDNAPLPEMPTAPLPAYVPAQPAMSFAAWLLVFSTVVSAALFGWLLMRWGQITRQVRRAKISEPLAALAGEAQKIVGLKFYVPVKLTPNSMSPAVCGLFRPAILIPQSLAENFSAEQVRAVLLHELIHLRRHDVWVNFLQTLLQIFYWWHPLVWLANARLRAVREEAVDDAVMLALRDEAEAYAPTLLEVAKLTLNRPLAGLGLVGILESRHALRQRIERLVDFSPPRQAGLTLVSLLGILAFTAVAVPMGEAPVAPSAVADATGDQALTVKVNPDIFIRNVKARADATMHATNDDYTAILVDILRGEGVDCVPPHGLAFNTQTGEIITHNTPEALEIFRQVIEQLNQPDRKGALRLDSAIHRQLVLISAQFYSMPAAAFGKVVQQFNPAKYVAGKSFVGAMAPDHFADFNHEIDSLHLTPFVRPRVQTSHGKPAQFFVGDVTNGVELNGVEFDCLPLIGDRVVELAFRVNVTGDLAGDGQTLTGSAKHTVSGRVTAEDQGGIVVCADNPAGSVQNNLVLVMSVQIVTNKNFLPPKGNVSSAQTVAHGIQTQWDASALVQDGNVLYEMGKLDDAEQKLNAALALDAGNAAAKDYLGLVQAARQNPKPNPGNSGRQQIVEKLDRIRLPRVSFERLSLPEALRLLSSAVKQNDPEKTGVNFLISATNRSVPIYSVVINVPAQSDLRLADVLDAMVQAADQPIEYSIHDYAVVFSEKTPAEPAKLFSRTFWVDANVFASALRKLSSLQTNNVSVLAKNFFRQMGVDFEASKGKAVFYNDRLGYLFVKATEADLDTIERAIQTLNQVPPQIHIKARFLEVPKDTVASFGKLLNPINAADQFSGILSETNAEMILHSLESRPGIEVLAEPEATTTTGRQTQMRATTIVTVVTNIAYEESLTNGPGAIFPQTQQVETGPILDVVPYVLADGYTINLTVIPSVTEFLGYDTPPDEHLSKLDVQNKIQLPMILPKFSVRQMTASLNLWDSQTVVVGGMSEKYIVKDKTPVLGSVPLMGRMFRSQHTNETEILIFITATIVDPAGNRVHGIQSVPGYFDDPNPKWNGPAAGQ
jgi:beta-lactamase regulating signal transducer with metallopeptidase domain/tetratricopeptide (TPR) repeat protein